MSEFEDKAEITKPRFPLFSVTIRLVDFGSLKALATIQLGEMKIRGFKVVETPNGGRFVAPPSREVRRNEGGKHEYYDLVKFDTKEALEQFRRIILEEYKKVRKEI